MPRIEVAKNASNQELYRPLVAMAKIPENADRISRVTKGVEAWMAAGDGEKPNEEQRMRDSFIGGLTKFGVKEILVETKDKKRYRVGQMPDGFRIINYKDLLDVSLDEKYSPQLRNELSQYADMVAMGTAEALVNTLINEGKVVGLYNENNLKDILDKDIVSGDHNVLSGVSELASGIARNVRFGRVEEQPQVVVTGGEGGVNELILAELKRIREATEKGGLGGVGGTQGGGGSLEDYFLREGLQKGNMEVLSKKEWLEGIRTKSYEKPTIPAEWLWKSPDWLPSGDNKEWRDLYGMTESLSYAVARMRKDGDMKTNVEYVKKNFMGFYELPEKSLKWLYEDQIWEREILDEEGNVKEIKRGVFNYGFREALETVVAELIHEDGEGEFTFNERVEGGPVDIFLTDSSKYRDQVANRLEGRLGDIDRAALMVSMAVDFLEMGGVFEEADEGRRYANASDALRTAMDPMRKFRSKVGGGEFWGGPWGNYFLSVSGNDKDLAREKAIESGVIPDRLSGSILNFEVKVRGQRDRVKLGRAILDRMDIEFSGAESDFYFFWKKDHVIPACDLWMYITRKQPLEFKGDFKEVDNAIQEWREGLYNDIQQLRRNNDSRITTRVVAGAVGGAVGLWPFPGPFLRLNKFDASMSPSYTQLAAQVVENLNLTNDETKELYGFFGITNKGANTLYQRTNDYVGSNNKKMPEVLRNMLRRNLMASKPNY